MSYLLTVYLLLAGELFGADVKVREAAYCAKTAEQIATDVGGMLLDFSCVLQVEI